MLALPVILEGTAPAYDERLHQLTPDQQPRWGRMDAGRMLAHLTDACRMATGDLAVAPRKGEADPDEDLLGDAVAFEGVAKYPARVKCALLGWMALKDAVAQAVTAREEELDR